MKINFDELQNMVGYSKTAYYYLASEKLITKETLENNLAEIELVMISLDRMKEKFGSIYTSPTHIEK